MSIPVAVPDSPYENPDVVLGCVVRVISPISAYVGMGGEVFDIESGYALVDLPKGSKMKAEGRDSNSVEPRRSALDRDRKTRGEPQWFPVGWLAPVASDGSRGGAP